MPHPISGRCSLVLVLLLGACGGSDGGGGSDAGTGPVTLVSRSWIQAASSESYLCRQIQANSDLRITSFHPLLPAGTFRMWVVTSDTPLNPTSGDFDCGFDLVATAGNRLIYVAGIGTNDLSFSNGVGVHVRSGQYVTLVLQVVNVQASALSGTSGVSVETASQLSAEADMILGGTLQLSIPANSTTYTQHGDCQAQSGWNILALLPMGNALEVSSTIELVHGATTTLHSAAYDLDQQAYYPQTATVAIGDTLRVTCSYVNTRPATVVFGAASTDEVCFAGVFRTPAPAVPDNPFACMLP